MTGSSSASETTDFSDAGTLSPREFGREVGFGARGRITAWKDTALTSSQMVEATTSVVPSDSGTLAKAAESLSLVAGACCKSALEPGSGGKTLEDVSINNSQLGFIHVQSKSIGARIPMMVTDANDKHLQVIYFEGGKCRLKRVPTSSQAWR
jgi:hypothetical protein